MKLSSFDILKQIDCASVEQTARATQRPAGRAGDGSGRLLRSVDGRRLRLQPQRPPSMQRHYWFFSSHLPWRCAGRRRRKSCDDERKEHGKHHLPLALNLREEAISEKCKICGPQVLKWAQQCWVSWVLSQHSTSGKLYRDNIKITIMITNNNIMIMMIMNLLL